MKINKNGVFFSGLFLLICGTLMISTIIFIEKNNRENDVLTGQITINKFNEITSYARYDYMSMLKIINLDSYVVDNKTTMLIISKNLDDNQTNITNLINDYSLFLKNNVAKEDNIDINSSINNTIYISTTSDYVTVNAGSMIFSINQLNEINFTIIVNESNSNLNQTIQSFNSGSTKINYRVSDINNNLIVSRSDNINLSKSNTLYLSFNSTSPDKYLNISFNNNIEIKTGNHLKAFINSSAKYNHTEKNKIYLNTGGNFILKRVGIEKGGPLVILAN